MGYGPLIGGAVVGAVVACAGVAAGQVGGLVVRDVRLQSGTTYNVFVAPVISPNGQHLTYGVMQITREGTVIRPTVGYLPNQVGVEQATSTLDTVWHIGPSAAPVLVLERAAGQAIDWSETPGQPVRVSSLSQPIVDNQGRVASRATLAVQRTQFTSDFYWSIVETSGGVSRAVISEAPVRSITLGTAASTSWFGTITPDRWVENELWGRTSTSVVAVPSGQIGPMRTVASVSGTSLIAATNPSGQVFRSGASGTEITRIAPTSGEVTPIASTGLAIPGQLAGTTYLPEIPSSSAGMDGQRVAYSNTGAAVFRSRQLPVTSGGFTSIWLSDGTVARRIATDNDAVAGFPNSQILIGGANIRNRTALAALDLPNGQTGAAFITTIAGVGSSNAGLFMNTPAGTSLIARNSFPMPLRPDGGTITINQFFGAFFNSRGQALIYAQVQGSEYSRVFMYDPVGGLALVPDTITLPNGEVVQVAFGVSGQMGQHSFAGAPVNTVFAYFNSIVTTSSSLTCPIADDGSYALVAFWQGGSAIVTGFIPAPGAAGVVVLAGCLAMRRRRIG